MTGNSRFLLFEPPFGEKVKLKKYISASLIVSQGNAHFIFENSVDIMVIILHKLARMGEGGEYQCW